MAKRLLAEAAGTFLLVVVGAGSVVVDARTDGALGPGGIALAFGAAVSAAVYAFGHISGAHINPAVTLGFWSAGHFPGREVAAYVLAQCAGAVAGAFVLLAAFGGTAAAGVTVPTVSLAEAFLLEGLFSFILMFMITAVALGGATTRAAAALVIGITVALDAFLGGAATGASMNPARSLGPAVAAGVWDHHWLYWVAPAAGMVAAIHAFETLRDRETAEVPEEKRLGLEGPIGEKDP